MDALSDSDLKYYIVSCVALSKNDVNSPSQFVTVAGSWLNITSPMVINDNVNILSVSITVNSVILVVDKLLDVPDEEYDSLDNVSASLLDVLIISFL